ncbi:MAG: hypothetical protein D6744_14345, partial [Planctomycetota bacterium]
SQADLAALVQQLGDDAYLVRDQATRRLVAMGTGIREALRAHLERARDPEIRRRLRYILANIEPPRTAVLVTAASAESGLRPGDVITHVNGRAVHSVYELRRHASGATFGATFRVRRAEGVHEVGPLDLGELEKLSDYVAPRGEVLARALRLYHDGFAERAADELLALDADESIRHAELPDPLRACILYTAGHAELALRLLEGYEEYARAYDERNPWTSPSRLDVALSAKAPYHLEWELFSRGGSSLLESGDDLDLRMQRVLVPAHRYRDTLLRAAELWWDRFRRPLAAGEGGSHVAGNKLAVIGWMFHELGLRSECCRLIEPRSAILRMSFNGPRKWVRVDTDAWLPLLAGDAKGALDSFYEHASDILANPPGPDDRESVIRNPAVAARIAFFLYQLPKDPRVGACLELVARDGHPVLDEYARWATLALDRRNETQVRAGLQRILPNLRGAAAVPTARAVALLEYVRPRPQRDVFVAARQRLGDDADPHRRERWVAIVDALAALARDDLDAARDALEETGDAPETAALRQTLQFRTSPPPGASNHQALAAPLLAVPIGLDDAHWLILSRDRRLLRFDVATGTLKAVDPPTPSWFPNPLCWPWIGREHATGRVWVYARRRVVEQRADGAVGLRLNIETSDIPAFDRVAAPVFSRLADAVVAAGAPEPGEQSEFLTADVKAGAELIADPRLREVAMIRALPRDERIVQIAMRGGPNLLLDPARNRVWDAAWIANAAGLERPPLFIARAVEGANPDVPPRVWLFTDQGLLLFDTGPQRVTRVALPGDDPTPPVVPESTPYDRADERFLYVARLPEEGGRVFRVHVSDLHVEPLEMVNEALPADYYRLLTRAEIRRTLDERLHASGMLGLQEFIADAVAVVQQAVRTTE